MQKLHATAPGEAVATPAMRDSAGTGVLPIQAAVDGDAIFTVSGRAAADAPWAPLKLDVSDDFLEGISWVPYLQLEITSGSGSVTLWVGEK